MYELPYLKDVETVVVDADVILRGKMPPRLLRGANYENAGAVAAWSLPPVTLIDLQVNFDDRTTLHPEARHPARRRSRSRPPLHPRGFRRVLIALLSPHSAEPSDPAMETLRRSTPPRPPGLPPVSQPVLPTTLPWPPPKTPPPNPKHHPHAP